MITSATSFVAGYRRPARVVIALVAGLAMALLAAPARADVGEGWSDPEPVDKLEALLLLAGIPLLLCVVIAAAVYLPAVVRGERVSPTPATPEGQWIGGPRQGAAAIESGDHAAAAETDAGGARGTW